MRRVICAIAFTLGAGSVAADTVQVRAPLLEEGSSWTVVAVDERQPLAAIALRESAIFWDLRPTMATRLVRWEVLPADEAGLALAADEVGATRALCATDVASESRVGCGLFDASEIGASGPALRWSTLPGSGRRVTTTLSPSDPIEVGVEFEERWAADDGALLAVHARAVAEGVALLPAGLREGLLLRETIRGSGEPRLRYRFIGTHGEVGAVLEGALPPPGQAFEPERGEFLATPAADDGIEIPYQKLSAALRPAATGFLQYSQENVTALSAIEPGWAGVPEMISIDATGVSYQPDPSDPGTKQILPEVWDFTALDTGTLTFRTFNTTRDGLAGNVCRENCAVHNPGPNPPDGSWQAFLKIDNYAPGGTYHTRDIFDLNDNDTGANPSIDVPYVAQNELNVDGGRTQICFQQSAGGANRFLRFFQFAGPDPASAVLGVGDTWGSGNWTECDNANGLKLTASILCPDACWPDCGAVNPRARGLLGNGVGLRSTIVEDGWVHVPPGNFVPALLMRQETDILAGIDFFGICNLSPTRNHAFDYFWLHEDYGLLALVSSPANDAILAENWSVVGNMTDGADFTWGPYPPYQASAEACLTGTAITWALPADGSNLNGEPGVSDYGYVVSWGASTDPDVLADWTTNPNHTSLPGIAGYLAAPAGSEPTSHVIAGWPGSTIHATVVTALRYTDPDVGDTRTYPSPAFYKVTADPATLDAGAFQVGNGVAPFVGKSGADLVLSWPAVPGAASYTLRVWNLDTMAEIACPVGLDCSPTLPTATHADAAPTAANYGYRAHAVDPCGEVSAN